MSNTLYREKIINATIREYGRSYDLLTFVDPEAAAAANAERSSLLDWLGSQACFGYADTKVDCRDLSPGCCKCGEGSWSCLFINGRCNGRCFYCPTAQDDDGPPVTNGIAFNSPEDYAAYVQSFGFSGVSISGGEPLLTPDLTISYLQAVRRRCGDAVHLWLYTNGTRLTTDLCHRLRDAGLDEIRFDLGAVNYHLKKLRLAVDVIPTVTVEIPAVPEDEGLLKAKLIEMKEAGVRHLNLHQLRLTPHNLPHLLERGYLFSHGEKVTVPASELTALRMVRYSIESGIGLPVNYCSFPYKRRYQHAAARRRAALSVCSTGDVLTEVGYLRRITDAGVQYFEAAVLQQPSFRCGFEKLTLDTGRALYVEQRPVSAEILLDQAGKAALARGSYPVDTIRYEQIERGLTEYF